METVALAVDDVPPPGAHTYKGQWRVTGTVNGNVSLSVPSGYSIGIDGIDFKR